MVCAVAAFGAFLFGYDSGAFGGAQILVRQCFQMSPVMFGCTASALLLGCLLATVGGLWIQEHLGARKCLACGAALFALGSLSAAFAPSAAALVLFRLLSGVATGVISIAAPMYISEMAPPAQRGRLGLLYQLSLTVGALLGMAVSWLLATRLSPDVAWRCMLGSTAAPSVFLLVLLTKLPESPRWLLTQGRAADALAVMQSIRSAEQATAELDAMRGGSGSVGGSYRELLGPGICWALLAGVLLGLFNNWTGGTGVASYLPVLFQQGGFPVVGDALAVVLLVSCVNVGFTVVSIWLVDHVGRRALWMSTAGGMTLAVGALGCAYHAGVTGPSVIALVLLTVMCHALGLAPLPWLMISELYSGPLRVRAVSVCTTVLWLSGFTSVLSFPLLAAWSEQHIGSIAAPFWAYAGMSLLALLFGWRLMPETRGKTLDEVARHFHHRGGSQETHL
jgi:SP family arabinose:H+ symporter-like MFS transporter